MDDVMLRLMADEIAALLCKYLPEGKNLALGGDSVSMKSKTCTQVFAFTPEQGGVFSVSAELVRPPPVPGSLNLKCVTSN